MKEKIVKIKWPETRTSHWLNFEKRNFFQIVTFRGLSIGCDSAFTEIKMTGLIACSKNNVEVLKFELIRYRLYRLYSMISWVVHSAFEKKPLIILFASISPIFAGLVDCFSFKTNGIGRPNRWLSGTLTAFTKLPVVPNCLFIPDIQNNHMIIKEANIKKIPIVSLITSDSFYEVAWGIPGNNADYKTVFQITKFFATLCNPERLNTKNFIVASKKKNKK